MLNDKLSHFRSRIRALAAELGNRPPAIADALIAEVFPFTMEAAEGEGCMTMLRKGMIDFIRNELTDLRPHQMDFRKTHPDLFPVIEELHRGAYYVPSRDEQVPVEELVDDAELVREAAQHLRKHARDTMAEAEKLTRLYRLMKRKAKS